MGEYITNKWTGKTIYKRTPEEIAAAKAQRANESAHCQICERAILAKSGVIAHHGYQRPGHGWQTASCFGAREKPYEISRDVLPKAIDSLRDFVKRHQDHIRKIEANPPRGYEVSTGWGHNKQPFKSLLRPAGFDPKADRSGYHYGEEFEYGRHFDADRAESEQQIRMSKETIKRLSKRFNDWKPVPNWKPVCERV